MDFAADAIADVIATPPARPAARGADDGSDFEAHLDAAHAADEKDDAAPVEAKSNAKDEPKDRDVSAEAQVQVQQAAAPPAPQQPAMTPVLAQLLGAEQAEAEPTPEADAIGAAPNGPQMPAAPQTARPETANATPPANAAETADAPIAAPESSAPPAPVQNADTAAPQPQAQQHEQALQTQPPMNAAATPISDEAAAALAALQTDPENKPAPAPQSAPAPPRAAKAEQTAAPKQTITEAPEIAVDAAPRAPQPDEEPTSAAKARSDYFAAAAAPEAAAPQPAQNNQASSATASILPASAAPAAQATAAVVEQASTQAAPAAAQVGREIIRRFDGQNTRFELRLDPPELGRVEVRLEVSRDHRVSAVVAADSPQALTELVRHARELEQTLQSAGLQLNDNGLSFDLRREPSRGETADNNGNSTSGSLSSDQSEAEIATPARPLGYERWRGVRVDMMV